VRAGWCVAVAAVLIAAAPAHADTYDLPVPSGTRRDPATPDLHVSSLGFRPSVDYYARELRRRGLAHQRIGPYQVRGVDVTRFVSADPASRWLAVHVYRQDGKTWIFLVKRPALAPVPLDVPARTE